MRIVGLITCGWSSVMKPDFEFLIVSVTAQTR
uniref:Uncharacterized protein n=1 Tax=Rhizophora mucronata TaxID=61149 RepID=A0A2P2PK57_RHIMU